MTQQNQTQHQSAPQNLGNPASNNPGPNGGEKNTVSGTNDKERNRTLNQGEPEREQGERAMINGKQTG